jgi:hypothetical protein
MTDRFTVMTVNIKFTLPINVPDEVTKRVFDELQLFARNHLSSHAVDEALTEHLADCEIAPDKELDAALDRDSLKVESDA